MTVRECACGCGARLDGMHPSARYATNACRSRAWKARANYVDRRKPRPSRNAARRRQPDLRISYRRALAAVAAHMAVRREPTPELAAERLLEPLLPPRARARVKDGAR